MKQHPKHIYKCLNPNCSNELHTNTKEYPFGWICLKCRKQGFDLILTCCDCGKQFHLKWDTYRKGYPRTNWRCQECVDKYVAKLNKETWDNKTSEELSEHGKKISAGALAFYKTEDPEHKQYRSNNHKKLYNDKTDEEKKEFSDLIKAGIEAMSDEAKIRHKINLSTSLKNHYINETLEDKQRRSKISKNIATNRTNEEKQRISKILSERQLERYSKETPKEKEERKLIHRLAWYDKSPEELEKYQKVNQSYEDFVKQELIKIKRLNDEKDRLSKRKRIYKNELKFKEILDNNFIKYNMFEYNEVEHPRFHELFPFNPFSKRGNNYGYTSPFHEWDFILLLNGTNIFVDIDGSHHNIHILDYDATDINDEVKINMKDKQIFYDSQRLYQTDGLDAYIVKCYDNKINDTTPVINIKTNQEIILKNFIKYCDQVIKDNYNK